MRLFRHYTEVPVEARGAVVAIGNFDGLHRGHQVVIGEAARIAAETGASLAVLTFEPHPRDFFAPDRPVFRLTPFRIKARQLEAMGLDYLFVLHFDAGLARKSAEAFVVEVLSQGLEVSHVVVGYDFVFGAGRRGDVRLLTSLGALHGFRVTSVAAAKSEEGETFSSTRIRGYLEAGKPAAAARHLGRPWEIEGRVERGDARGRAMGFPTANLPLGEFMPPALGVYAVKAGIDAGRATLWRDGVAYLGSRPTFAGATVLLEVHLFDFAGDLYGRHLRVALLEHLRPDQLFDGMASLRAQIAADAARARAVLASYAGPTPGAAPVLAPRRPLQAAPRSVYERALRPRSTTGG